MIFDLFVSLSQSEEAPIDDLMELVQQIVAFHMKVNSFFFCVCFRPCRTYVGRVFVIKVLRLVPLVFFPSV